MTRARNAPPVGATPEEIEAAWKPYMVAAALTIKAGALGVTQSDNPTENEVIREAIKFAQAGEFITEDGAERMLAALKGAP